MSEEVAPAKVQRLVDALGDADAHMRLQVALTLGEGRHGMAAGHWWLVSDGNATPRSVRS